MELLLHEAAMTRIATHLEEVAEGCSLLVMNESGQLHRDGTTVPPGDAAPAAVWLSVDALLSPHLHVLRDVAQGSPNLRWVQIGSAGVDDPFYRRLYERGVKLSSSDAQAVAVAEFVIGSVFSRWYPNQSYHDAQARRAWGRIPFREVSESQWLIVGYGRIGGEIARRLIPFDVQLTAVRRTPVPSEEHCRMAVLADLPKLLPHADVVVLANALTDEAIDMADAAFFGRMKQGSFFVNVGRGASVGEQALLHALDSGCLSCAILDVFKEEPLPTASPLWAHPRVRLTTHTAAAGTGTRSRADRQFIANLRRFMANEPLISEVSARSF
jgi:phosphoglycerate dehydrogenase-like enzyme